jgi:hypothetical protein
MPEEPEGTDSISEATQGQPAGLTGTRLLHKPPRPAMSDLTPAPIRPPVPPPGIVKAMRWVWRASFIAGLAAGLLTYFTRDAQLERLERLLTERQSTLGAEALDSITSTILWGSIGTVVFVILVEALLLKMVMRRRSGARWALLAVLPLHGGATIMADAFLVAPPEGVYFRVFLLVQLLLAGTAVALSVQRRAQAWFRAE